MFNPIRSFNKKSVFFVGLVFTFSVMASSVLAETAKPEVSTDNIKATTPSTGVSSKKTCDDIKASIEEKIKAKGVKTFSLEIVGVDEVKDAKVVGSCEGGKKKITYKRG